MLASAYLKYVSPRLPLRLDFAFLTALDALINEDATEPKGGGIQRCDWTSPMSIKEKNQWADLPVYGLAGRVSPKGMSVHSLPDGQSSPGLQYMWQSIECKLKAKSQSI